MQLIVLCLKGPNQNCEANLLLSVYVHLSVPIFLHLTSPIFVREISMSTINLFLPTFILEYPDQYLPKKIFTFLVAIIKSFVM